ncbi:hypothetical protein [Methanosphaera cuniculi]|uniref:hypothetical protein n=1 Tax=Methanosphaera cuniculi TaxID=1077256 RepID=UPI0026EB0252|nr:hypothetical protein [Methanosphaera cuniculi]
MLKCKQTRKVQNNGSKNSGVRINVPEQIASLMDLKPKDLVDLELQVESVNDVRLVITKHEEK